MSADSAFLALATRNVVFVVTMHNSVYAYDADVPTSTTPLWYVNLGTSVLANQLGFRDISPGRRNPGTPIIDTTRGVIYLVAETYEGGAAIFRLHALSLTTGQESLQGPTVINASSPGIGQESSDGMVSFVANQHLQRPGLLLLNDVVYIAFGSHGDDSPYHGWLLATMPPIFRSSCTFSTPRPIPTAAACGSADEDPWSTRRGTFTSWWAMELMMA